MRARVYQATLGGFTKGKTVYVEALSMMRMVNACIDKYKLKNGYLKPGDMKSVNDLSAITVYDDKKHVFIKEVPDEEAAELFKKKKVVPVEKF